MDTIDIQRDPCAEAIARAMVVMPVEDELEARDGEATTMDASRTPRRDRPIKYVRHPSYERFLRPR